MNNMTQAQVVGGNSLPCPILVTGAARSGVSMTAGVLRRCGAWVGVVDNSYENIEIRDKTITPYLKFLGCDPHGQNPLPVIQDVIDKPLAGLVRRVETAVKFQGYTFGPWMYKSNSILLTYPMWCREFPLSKWIIVRRDDKDIINSCLKTKYMKGHSDEAEWQGYLDAHKTRIVEIEECVKDCREVWPSRMVDGDFGEIKEVVEWLKLRWNEGRVREWIRPNLWRACNVS